MRKTAIDLVALDDFTFYDLPLRRGDRFVASPIDAAALTYRHKALFAEKAGHLPPPPPVEYVEPAPVPARPRRRYRRRDLTAEES